MSVLVVGCIVTGTEKESFHMYSKETTSKLLEEAEAVIELETNGGVGLGPARTPPSCCCCMMRTFLIGTPSGNRRTWPLHRLTSPG